MQFWYRYKKVIFPITAILLGISVFAILKATKPQTPLMEVEERYWPVAVKTVHFTDTRPLLTSFGEIRAGREAELRPQVSGRVLDVHPDLGDGAPVRAGDVLVRIDDFDYLANKQERLADLNEAEARLNELNIMLDGEEKLLPVDKKQVDLAARELERQRQLLKRSAVSKKAYDDAQLDLNTRKQNVLVREQTIARFRSQIIQAQSALEKAKTALSRAQRDLEDTVLKAPFDGFLTQTDVTQGKQVSTSDRLARLISLDRLEVGFHLSEAAYARLTRHTPLQGRPVQVDLQRGAHTQEFKGKIVRIDARVDAATGGRNIFAALSDLTLETDLRPGLFVKVRVPDKTYKTIVSLPVQAVHDNSYVYVVKNSRLQKRNIEIAAQDGKQVLIAHGLKTGEQVCITRFAEMGAGVKVLVK
jgi:RND family efflux transporter MFP subunit